MKRITSKLIGVAMAVACVGASAGQDLEVTMDVVAPNASASAAMSEIKLPDTAASQAQDNAAFGLSTANKARDMRGELGQEFGRDVAEAARERARERPPNANRGRP